MSRPRRPGLTGDEGFAAGGEMLALGALVFIVGTLVVLSGWRVVDAKFAAAAAAREATRAYVESTEAGTAVGDAHAAAVGAISAHGLAHLPVGVDVDGVFARCERVAVRVRLRTPALSLPWVGGVAATDVSAVHSELVDPLRSGVPGQADCIAADSGP